MSCSSNTGGGMKSMEFWFEFASTYSYPAAMRVEAAAGKAGVPVIWKPFLLGPIFQAEGYESSPFFAFPVKGQYMWRDIERLCAKYHLEWIQQRSFQRTSILASKIDRTDERRGGNTWVRTCSSWWQTDHKKKTKQ